MAVILAGVITESENNKHTKQAYIVLKKSNKSKPISRYWAFR